MSIEELILFLATSLGMLILFLLVAWSLVWKGLALWKAARRNSLGWFVVLLIVNTLGILEILYIFVFSKCCKKEEAIAKKKRR